MSCLTLLSFSGYPRDAIIPLSSLSGSVNTVTQENVQACSQSQTPLPSSLAALQTNMGSGTELTCYLRARHIFKQEENRMCLHTTMIFCATPSLAIFQQV